MSKIQSPPSNCFIPFCEPQDVMHQGFVAWAEKEYKEKKKKDIINKDMDIIKNTEYDNGIIIKTLPDQTFEDDRGKITILLEQIPCESLLRITSKKDSIRANHWHKIGWHFCILYSGLLNYYERPLGSNIIPIKLQIKPGTVFFTKSKTEHAMEFLEDSMMFCMSRLSRNQESYEADTIRLNYNLIDYYASA